MFNYQNTKNIGDVGEAYAVAEFIKAGFLVSRPFTENCPYDMIVDWKGRLYKVQVKTTASVKNNESMQFELSRTNGFKNLSKSYTKDEIDYYYLYCVENGWSGIMNVNDPPKSGEVRLHFELPANNGFVNYRMQDDYVFDHKIQELITGVPIPPINRIAEIEAKRIKNLEEKQEKQKAKPPVDEIEGRVTREDLKGLIRTMPFTKIGKMFGVSDNSVRKWCTRMGLPDKSTVIPMYSDEEWERI